MFCGDPNNESILSFFTKKQLKEIYLGDFSFRWGATNATLAVSFFAILGE